MMILLTMINSVDDTCVPAKFEDSKEPESDLDDDIDFEDDDKIEFNIPPKSPPRTPRMIPFINPSVSSAPCVDCLKNIRSESMTTVKLDYQIPDDKPPDPEPPSESTIVRPD